MSNKMSLVQLRHTVRAWVANTEDAKHISIEDLGILQKIFDDKLNIIHTNDGGIAIFPHCPGNREIFDAFMERNGRFQQRPIQITTI